MSLDQRRAGREYTIGDAARLLGVSIAWIKDRETRQILPSARRTRGGHRTYNSEELHQMRILAAELSGSGLQARTDPLNARIAVLNQKGGVGKTTVAQNLGVALANAGYRVLLVDLDRQYNLTTGFGITLGETEQIGLGYALCRAAEGEESTSLLRQSLVETVHPHVHLIPTDMRMFDAEAKLRNDSRMLLSPHRLSRMIDPLAREYDVTIIDCPPDLGILTVNGILSAEGVIIPVDHDYSLHGIRQLQNAIDEAAQIHRRVPILGVLLNKFDRRTIVGQTVEEKIRRNFGELLFRTRIAQTTRIQESQMARTPLLCYDPRHAVSRQFEELATEVIERIRALRRTGQIHEEETVTDAA